MNLVLVLLLVLSVAVFIYLGVALFKAEPGHGPTEVDVGLLHLDLIHYQATFKGRDLDLTAREFEFLAFLARHAGKVCTRRMIPENVWGPGYANEVNYLKVYAYRIRRKLGDDDGNFLQSDPSVGYRLVGTAGR
ncbi:MAG TPA: winged helix-turn-helix domain-containing protein [Streptosporangiaceae bacterium]|jgi:two-component system KDP operon response regulator KdpE